MYAFAETQTYADDYGGPAWSRKRKWHFNQQWIRSCYGKAYLQELWNVHSTCAGCLMGGMPALLQYLQIWGDEFVRVGKCAGAGSDTAVSQRTLRKLMPEAGGKVDIVPFTKGLVVNMGPIPIAWDWDAQGRMLNKDGEVYAVVHQADRNGSLWDRYRKEWQQL